MWGSQNGRGDGVAVQQRHFGNNHFSLKYSSARIAQVLKLIKRTRSAWWSASPVQNALLFSLFATMYHSYGRGSRLSRKKNFSKKYYEWGLYNVTEECHLYCCDGLLWPHDRTKNHNWKRPSSQFECRLKNSHSQSMITYAKWMFIYKQFGHRFVLYCSSYSII